MRVREQREHLGRLVRRGGERVERRDGLRRAVELQERARERERRRLLQRVVRVLAEAENEEDARKLCGTIASLVSTELG